MGRDKGWVGEGGKKKLIDEGFIVKLKPVEEVLCLRTLSCIVG